MMYHLDPSKQETAIKLATTLDKDIEGVNLQVCIIFSYIMMIIIVHILFISYKWCINSGCSFFFSLDCLLMNRYQILMLTLRICGWYLQNCTRVLQALRNEEFGSCPEQVAEYEARCRVNFPYAQVFRPPLTICQSSPTAESNHISDGKENCISNWCWPSPSRWPSHYHYFASVHSSAQVGDIDL
jgi:hypothetical protein